MKALQGYVDSVLAAGSLPDAHPATTAEQVLVSIRMASGWHLDGIWTCFQGNFWYSVVIVLKSGRWFPHL